MKNGFTLIELLIVVAIIGILAAIAVPNFLNAQLRAKISRGYSDMRSLSTAVEMMRTDRNVLLVDWWDDDREWGQERLQDIFNMVGAGPDFEQRNTIAILSPLTSPVAYMGSIPIDPFSPEGAMQSYRYGDNDTADPDFDHGYGALFPGNVENTGLQVLNSGEFIFIGIGPDGELGLGAGYGDPVRGLPYDASNGLVSSGDITLRGSGGINQ